MSRRPDPARREALARAVLDYALAHGVADLSLRPLAQALGASTYTLVYHFGSREGVVAAMLAEAEERLRQMVAGWLEEPTDAQPASVLSRVWAWSVTPEAHALNRLYFEIYGLALRDPARFPGFLERAGPAPWVALLRSTIERAGASHESAEDLATLSVAIVLGLQLDLLTTGDHERTTRALTMAATLLGRHGEHGK